MRGETKIHDQAQKNELAELIKDKPPEQLALAWQNFLKRFTHGAKTSEIERLVELLKEDIKEDVPKKHNIKSLLQRKDLNSPISDAELQLNVEELKEYLRGNLNPNDSQILKLILGNYSITEVGDSTKHELATNLLNEYIRIYVRIKNKLDQIDGCGPQLRKLNSISKKREELVTTIYPIDMQITIMKELIEDLTDLERETNSMLGLKDS